MPKHGCTRVRTPIWSAWGRARLNPADNDIPEIGDELAVARALTDLGHRLLLTAAADIGAVTGERVALPR